MVLSVCFFSVDLTCEHCDPAAECTYDILRLIYRCVCRQGYTGDGRTCSQIDYGKTAEHADRRCWTTETMTTRMRRRHRMHQDPDWSRLSYQACAEDTRHFLKPRFAYVVDSLFPHTLTHLRFYVWIMLYIIGSEKFEAWGSRAGDMHEFWLCMIKLLFFFSRILISMFHKATF